MEGLTQLLQQDPSQRSETKISTFLPTLRSLSDAFRFIQNENLIRLLKYCEVEGFVKNEVLIRQQEFADCCYIILSGKVSVYEARSYTELNNLARLAAQHWRTRTRSRLQEIEASRREAIGAFVSQTSRQKRSSQSRAGRRISVDLSAELDEGKPPLREFTRRKSVTLTVLEKAEANLVDRQMSLAQRVSLRFSMLNTDSDPRSQLGTYVDSIGPGNLIGHVSLLHGGQRVASVVVDSDSLTVIRINSELFDDTLREAIDLNFHRKRKFIDESPLFNFWSDVERKFLASVFNVRQFEFGEVIVQQGDEFTEVHFIIDGEVEVLMNSAAHNALYKAEIQECKELLRMITQKIDLIRSSVAHARTKDAAKPPKQLESGTSKVWKDYSQNCVICTLNPVSIVGDIEVVLNFKQYVQTVVCKQSTVVLSMSKRHYERAVKRYSATSTKMLEQLNYKLASRLSHNEALAVEFPLLKFVELKTHYIAQQQRYHEYQQEQIAAVPVSLRGLTIRLSTAEIQRDYEAKAKLSPLDSTDLHIPTDYMKKQLGPLSARAGFNREMEPVAKNLLLRWDKRKNTIPRESIPTYRLPDVLADKSRKSAQKVRRVSKPS